MKMKKIIVSTFLTGVFGLSLVACGSKKAAAELVDENGKKYTVEETEEPEEVSKVLDSIARKAMTTTDEVKERKYGIDVKAKAKIGFNNEIDDEKYNISLNANATTRFDLPKPEVDEESGDLTDDFASYFKKIGFSAGFDASLKSNFPGLTIDSEASVDFYSDEEKIYAKFGTLDFDDLVDSISLFPTQDDDDYEDDEEDDFNYGAVLSIVSLLSDQKLYLAKESGLAMLDGVLPRKVEHMLENIVPTIYTYYEAGPLGLVSSFQYDSYLKDAVSTETEITTSNDDDVAVKPAFSFESYITDFVDTFNLSISDVDGSDVTFSMGIPFNIMGLMQSYTHQDDDPLYTKAEIAAIYDDEDFTPIATLSLTLDVKNMRPTQVKLEAEDLVDVTGYYLSRFFAPKEPEIAVRSLLNDVVETDATTTTGGITDTSISISPEEQNFIDFMTALSKSEIETAEASIIIDFVYGKDVNKVSENAAKDYHDITPIINAFLPSEKEELR